MGHETKSAWKRFRHGLQETRALYCIVAACVYILDLLPLELARCIGRCGGWLAYHLDRGHRALCLDNLAIAFPEKSAAECHAILKKSYMHLGVCAVDFCKFRSVRSEDLLKRWIVCEEGSAERMRALFSQDRGIIAIGAHIGFWELSGFAQPGMGFPTISIARKIPAPHINELVTRIRSRLGNEIVYQDGALRHMLRALKEKKAVGVIADHYAGRESPWIPFFSREASTVDTCAKLHLKTGAPMVVNVMLRQPDGKYLFRCRHIDVPAAAGEIEDERVRQILRRMNKEFEDAIRLAPEQWLWMHKRWKPKPEPAPTLPTENSPSPAGVSATIAMLCVLAFAGANSTFAAEAQTKPVEVRLPVEKGDIAQPVMAVFTEHGGKVEPGENPKLLAAIWKDGRIVWSADKIEGGAPYKESMLAPEKVDAAFDAIDTLGAFKDAAMRRRHFGPDSSFTTIAIASGERRLYTSSWHELYEAGGKLVATASGLIALGGRDLKSVLAAQPEDYRHYRARWDELRKLIAALIPAEGKERKELRFELQRAPEAKQK